jgi:hypothetical protein
VIAAAALCPAAPLLVRELTGGTLVLPELRAACREATGRLLAARPDVIAVAGAGSATRTWDSASGLDVASFGGSAVAGRGPAGPAPGTPGLPVPLGLGARLLDEAGYAGPRLLRAIGQDEAPAACAAEGQRLGQAADRVALLVMADGSARRGRRAPGHFDERSAGFDAGVERAVRDGDLAALAAIDAGLARELMAAGRPAWQVMAGTLGGAALEVEVLYADDPFGVAYLVAAVTVRAGSGGAGADPATGTIGSAGTAAGPGPGGPSAGQ